MATIQHTERDLDAAFHADVPGLSPHFKAVRRATPNVITVLRRANNPFVTGVQGWESIGLAPEDFERKMRPVIPNPDYREPKSHGDFTPPETIPNPDFDAQMFGEFVPKVLEAVVLLCCERDELKACVQSLTVLDDLVFDAGESGVSDADVYALIPVVQKEMEWVNQSTGQVKDDKSDAEAVIAEGKGEKKPDPASAPVTS